MVWLAVHKCRTIIRRRARDVSPDTRCHRLGEGFIPDARILNRSIRDFKFAISGSLHRVLWSTNNVSQRIWACKHHTGGYKLRIEPKPIRDPFRMRYRPRCSRGHKMGRAEQSGSKTQSISIQDQNRTRVASERAIGLHPVREQAYEEEDWEGTRRNDHRLGEEGNQATRSPVTVWGDGRPAELPVFIVGITSAADDEQQRKGAQGRASETADSPCVGVVELAPGAPLRFSARRRVGQPPLPQSAARGEMGTQQTMLSGRIVIVPNRSEGRPDRVETLDRSLREDEAESSNRTSQLQRPGTGRREPVPGFSCAHQPYETTPGTSAGR